MFGFCGIYNHDQGNFKSSVELLNQSVEIDYPDCRTTSFFSKNEIMLCQFCTDLFSNEVIDNEDIYLIGRCRLDNYKDLSSKLGLSESETSMTLVAYAYKKWGEACLEHFIGDYSFALWDKRGRCLVLAKDHLGIRPLFYIYHKGLLYFANTLPVLKSILPFKPELNRSYIAKELVTLYQDVEDTFFLDIKRLRPAHFLKVVNGKDSKEHRYWELNEVDVPRFKSEQEYWNLLREALFEAVQCRIRGHQTVGCQLSGGLDSSALTVIASRLMDKNFLHTYSLVLTEKTAAHSKKGIDEQNMQNSIINYANLAQENHHRVEEFHFEDVYQEIDLQNKVMGGMAKRDAIWQDTMFLEGKKNNVSVMISGFPGDEVMSYHGYRHFYDYVHNKEILNLFRFLMEFRLTGLRRLYKYYVQKHKNHDWASADRLFQHHCLLSTTSDYYQEWKSRVPEFDVTFREMLKKRAVRPHTAMRAESEGLYALRHGIETVYPMADIRLLQLACSLPASLFRPKPQIRSLFRNVCKGILPDDVRLQKKDGGALTLAFAEYWYANKAEQLHSYTIKNHTGLLIDENDLSQFPAESQFGENKRIVNLKKADYLIGLNWHEAMPEQ